MKNNFDSLVKVLRSMGLFQLIILLIFMGSCEKEGQIEFSGFVFSHSQKPVSDAVVVINKEETRTNEKGYFKILARKSDTNDFLVSVRKFGFGLYSNKFNEGFKDKKIFLTEGTIVTFDPARDNTISDTESFKNPFKPALLDLDTAKLFKVIPKVYDHTGQLIDIGYPDEMKNIFDYLRIPLGGVSGVSLSISGNSLVNSSGNTPPSGTQLQAALTTVDFFNPDGMPGDFIVETEQGLGYMESFSAATIEITDGKNKYQLKKGAKARVTFPIYPIRLGLKEVLPEKMPLLHFNETTGRWMESGIGILNEEKNAYVAEVDHFSVLNMDIIKTGDSKCFKIRQMLKTSVTDNSANYLSQYRAQVIVPATATTNFKENDYLVNETLGCVPVVANGGLSTTLHAITRIPNTYIAVVFSKVGVADTMDIVIAQPAPTSIPAETAVASANDCSTATCTPASCTSPDPHNISASPQSICNTSCWFGNCGFIPFSNVGPELKIIAIPMGGGKVKVKWLNTNASLQGSLQILQYNAASCSGAGATIFDKCPCGPAECISGEVNFNGTVGATVSFRIQAYDNSITDCTGIPNDACSNSVVIL